MREAKSDVVGKQVVEVCPLSIFYLYIVITMRDIINLMEKRQESVFRVTLLTSLFSQAVDLSFVRNVI